MGGKSRRTPHAEFGALGSVGFLVALRSLDTLAEITRLKPEVQADSSRSNNEYGQTIILAIVKTGFPR